MFHELVFKQNSVDQSAQWVCCSSVSNGVLIAPYILLISESLNGGESWEAVVTEGMDVKGPKLAHQSADQGRRATQQTVTQS